MRFVSVLWIIVAACTLSACAVTSVIGTAASVTGTVVSTTAHVAGDVISATADLVTGDGGDHKKSK
jgi:hypothetical protein